MRGQPAQTIELDVRELSFELTTAKPPPSQITTMSALADILIKINDDLEVESELREVSRSCPSAGDL